jgi:ABC-type proline/glycine betaine transport system permease subunit
VTACFGFIAVFGQWNNAMITLASILIAVPLGAAGGSAAGHCGMALAGGSTRCCGRCWT